MDAQAIRILIRDKLKAGRLPHDSTPRFFGGPGSGEQCDACGLLITTGQLLMESISKVLDKKPFQFHVACFQLWEHERREPKTS